MSFPFSDDFESYPLGSHPSTWGGTLWDSPPSSGTVVSGSPDGVGSQSFQLGLLQHTEGFAEPGLSHKFNYLMGLGGGLNSGGLILSAQQGTGGFNVFGIGMNGDGTIYANVIGDPFSHQSIYAGSSVTALQRNTWYSIRADAGFVPYIVGVNTYIHVDVFVAINGIQEIEAHIDTGVLASVLPLGLGANRWVFQPGTVNGSTIDNIVVEGGGSGPIPPPPATEPAKIFQGALEVIYDPQSISAATIYQGAIEILRGKTTPPSVIATCVMHD